MIDAIASTGIEPIERDCPLTIHKFGGAALANADAIRAAVSLIAPPSRDGIASSGTAVVVVSAFAGVTECAISTSGISVAHGIM